MYYHPDRDALKRFEGSGMLARAVDRASDRILVRHSGQQILDSPGPESRVVTTILPQHTSQNYCTNCYRMADIS